jgi:spore maturation protein CgeB
MLVEDTQEHQELFGADGEAVVYFESVPEMLDKVRWLLNHPEARSRLRSAVRRLVREGEHTYRDRLAIILQSARLTSI